MWPDYGKPTNLLHLVLQEILQRGDLQTHAFHVEPSMGPIVSVMNLSGQQTSCRKVEQSTRPGNGTVYV